MPDSTLKDAAHAHARRGWHVIQLHSVGPDGLTCSCNRGRNCKSAGKHPVLEAWQAQPRLSAADIEALWDEHPKRNVGIATGEPSGFFVLDLDADDGKGGLESAARLAAEHGDFWGTTYTVQTGGGGYQLYWLMPDFHVGGSNARFKDGGYHGIDIRGTGGQVVAPPSRSSKGSYSVVVDVPIAPAPAWLLEMVRPKEEKAVVTASDVPDRSDIPEDERRRLDAYADRIVQGEVARLQECSTAATPGGRDYRGPNWNDTTFQVACTLIQLANSPWNELTETAAYELVHQHAPRDPGFGDAEVNTCFGSAKAKIGDRARDIPPASAAKPAASSTDWMFASAGVANPAAAAPQQQAPGQLASQGVHHDPFVYVDSKKGGLQTVSLAYEICKMGPLAWGSDKQFWSYENGVWQSRPDIITSRVIHILQNQFRVAHVTNVAPVVSEMIPRLPDVPQPEFLNFQNGMLHWRTGEMLPHDPNHQSTIQFPLDWVPDAECPAFEGFLNSVLSPDYVELAWEMLGYLMYSGNPLQVAFLFHGTGGNGKGTLIRVIEAMLGKENLSNVSLDSLNENRFAALSLYGKIANIAGDIDATFQTSTATFKKLTGEDTLSAEIKYGPRFDFTNWAVPLFSANKIPGSADVSEGYLRRWVLLEFSRSIPASERKLGLSDLLIAELPGIVAKAVRSLHTLMTRGGGFRMEGDVALGKATFAHAIDQVRQWVEDSTVMAPEHVAPRDNLYMAYRNWAERNGSGKLKAMEFYERLNAIGAEGDTFGPVKIRGKRSYKGIMAAPVQDSFLGQPTESLMDRILESGPASAGPTAASAADGGAS